MEDYQEHNRILLHLEDDGSICSAKARQIVRTRVKTETSLHPEPVSFNSPPPSVCLSIFLLQKYKTKSNSHFEEFAHAAASTKRHPVETM